MFDLRKFIARCAQFMEGSDPVGDIRTLLSEEIKNVERFAAGLPPIKDEETLLHRSSNLYIVNLRLTPNVHYPPHNHHMPVILGVWGGSEINISYERTESGLRKTGEKTLSVGDVPVVPKEAIHSVVNDGETYSNSFHVYLGDLSTQERTIWRHETSESFPYSDETYFELAVPYRADRPFNRPETCYAHS